MKSILILFFSTLVFPTFSQTDTLTFPHSWEGKWAGNLEIFNATGKVQELPMELHIQPLDSAGQWTWAIIYGEDKVAGLRPYELHTLDVEMGRYLIDEKNSIGMEAYYLGGKFFQWFEVEGSLLLTTTWLAGDELHWEIVFGKSDPASLSGGEVVDGEEVSQVKTFPVNGVQRAVLRRG